MLLQRMLGAAALLALSTGLAAAAPAAVERSANVRTGPGTGYPVVATLPRGSVVDAGPCSGGWCRIAWDGGEGYMARSLLALGAGGPAVAIGPAPYYDDYYDDSYFGYAYGPSVGVTIPRHRWRHHRPGRPGWGDNRPGRPGWGDNRPGRPGWGGRPNRPPVAGNPAPVPDGKSFRQGGRSGGFATGGGAFRGGRFATGGGGSRGGASSAAPSSTVGSGASAPARSAPASSGAVSKFR